MGDLSYKRIEIKRGIEMERYMEWDEQLTFWHYEANINLLPPVTKYAQEFSSEVIINAYNVIQAKTFDEIRTLIESAEYTVPTLDWSTFETLEQNGDLQMLKERLIVHFYTYTLYKHYLNDIPRSGPKNGRLLRFFDAVTSEPVKVWDLADKYYLEHTTVKNHRRFDPFSEERGITKIKNGKIFRQPVDG